MSTKEEETKAQKVIPMVSMCTLARKHDWDETTVESQGETFTVDAYCKNCSKVARTQGFWEEPDPKCMHENTEAYDVLQDNLESTSFDLRCSDCPAHANVVMRWEEQ